MSYTAEISRVNPTCFIFVLDQSGSMADAFGGDGGVQRKSDFLADVVNRTIYDLVLRCTKPEEVRNYYNVSILGYGSGVGVAFGGALSGREMVSMQELADNPIRVETRTKKVPDGAGGLVEQQVKFPVWVEPYASGGTPMVAALNQVQQILEKWYADPQHKSCFPPTVLHITDGGSTDGDPTEIGRKVMSMAGSDGQVLFYNCHITSDKASKLEYPSSEESLPSQQAKTLFTFSSILPEKFKETASQIGVKLDSNGRGFVFNADTTSLVQFFDIGTRPANLR